METTTEPNRPDEVYARLDQIAAAAANIVALLARAQRGSMAPECVAGALKQAEQIEASSAEKIGPKPVHAVLDAIREKAARMKGWLEEMAAYSRAMTMHSLPMRPLDEAVHLAAEIAEQATLAALQRADLDPVAEATAYVRLLTLPGYSASRVADRTGKSRSHIDERVQLLASCSSCASGAHKGWEHVERQLITVPSA
jgi:hypothetical protein